MRGEHLFRTRTAPAAAPSSAHALARSLCVSVSRAAPWDHAAPAHRLLLFPAWHRSRRERLAAMRDRLAERFPDKVMLTESGQISNRTDRCGPHISRTHGRGTVTCKHASGRCRRAAPAATAARHAAAPSQPVRWLCLCVYRSEKAVERKARRERARPERPISLPEIQSPERQMPVERAATSMDTHDKSPPRQQPRMSKNMNQRFAKAEVRPALCWMCGCRCTVETGGLTTCRVRLPATADDSQSCTRAVAPDQRGAQSGRQTWRGDHH